MRTTLTVEQSAELIWLGVNSERASQFIPVDAPYRTSGVRLAPVFGIDDLFQMLPKEIIRLDGYTCGMSVTWYGINWKVKYAGVLSCEEVEFIDALFEMFVKLIENNYVNTAEL